MALNTTEIRVAKKKTWNIKFSLHLLHNKKIWSIIGKVAQAVRKQTINALIAQVDRALPS